jgi:hypothetical protein
MKRHILQGFSYVCFVTFVVQNLPARGRKTEKNKAKKDMVNDYYYKEKVYAIFDQEICLKI